MDLVEEEAAECGMGKEKEDRRSTYSEKRESVARASNGHFYT